MPLLAVRVIIVMRNLSRSDEGHETRAIRDRTVMSVLPRPPLRGPFTGGAAGPPDGGTGGPLGGGRARESFGAGARATGGPLGGAAHGGRRANGDDDRSGRYRRSVTKSSLTWTE